MKVALLILALIGSACALQPSVEYHYKYEGRVATGIPAIRSQVAAVGFRADVILQMRTKLQGVMKFNNVQVGEFNDDLECASLRQIVPLRWSPMPAYKQQLEEPFTISFEEDLGTVMKVPQSDVEFITNIRKSVVGALRIEHVAANLGGIKAERLMGRMSGGETPESFSGEEETIFGRCESQYTITKIPKNLMEQEKNEIKKTLKEDEQVEGSPRGRGVSVPKLGEHYWRLVRAINFDKCHDRVILQQTGVGNMSQAGFGQFESIMSRSSVGEWILKGQPHSFRIERAVIEGDVIANPFGVKTHRLQTITNQTLALERAQSIQTDIKMTNQMRDVKTWRYEVASPFSGPEGQPKPWVNYHNKNNNKLAPVNFMTSLLGLPISSAMVQEYKRNLMEMLDETVRMIYSEPSQPKSQNPTWESTKESLATTYLHYMSRMMRALPESDIEHIFSQVFANKDIDGQRKQMILCDVSAASGAAAPIHALIQKFKSGQITSKRMGSILMTINNNLIAPSIIPDLVDLAKSADIEKNPLYASTAVINVATLVQRNCLSRDRFNFSLANPVFGSQACKPSQIMSSFLPDLERKAKSASKSWERAVYLQAIANLGSHAVIPVLTPFIHGEHDASPSVRRAAIYGLARKNMPNYAREAVFDSLMEVIDNLREAPEIRQTAMVAAFTWHPDSAWWQRMARMTWKEPNQEVAAFITSTVQSLAKATEPHLHQQSKIAAFVLPLLKPFSPSIKYSANYFYSRFSETAKAGLEAKLTYIHSLRDAIPQEIYAGLCGDFGGLHVQVFETALESAGLSEIIINYLRSSVGVEESSYSQNKEAYIFMRAFENIQQFIPLNSDVLSKISGGSSEVIQKLIRGQKMNITKYASPVDLEFFFPTEIGLPVMGEVAMPTMNKGDVEVKLSASHMSNPSLSELMRAENVTLLLKTNYKYMSKMIVKMQIPAPWNKKMVEAGVDNLREINLPIYGNITLRRTPEVKNLTINLAPSVQHKFPVVYAHNIPYTEIRDMIPSTHLRSDYKVIAMQKNRSPALKIHKEFQKKYTGLSFDMMYNSDTADTFNSAAVVDALSKPESLIKHISSPSAHQYQYFISMQPQPSSPQNVSLSLAYLSLQQESGSGSIPAISAQDTVPQRMEKLRKLSEGSKVYGLNAQLMFNSTEFRKYEVLMAVTRKSQSQQKKEYKTLAAVMTNPIPGYTQSPKAICSQAELSTANVPTLEALKQLVQSRPQETVRGDIHYGKDCQAPKILSFKGSMEVSSERLALIRSELNHMCNYDQVNPVVELQTPAIYDEGQFEAQVLAKDQIPVSLTNFTLSLHKWAEGFVFPNGYYNMMHRGQENKMTLSFKRPISSKGFTFWNELPQKYSIITEIGIPDMVSRIVPWGGLKTSFQQHSESSNVISDSSHLSLYGKSNTVCYRHVYPVKKEQNQLCVTEQPVQICSVQCIQTGVQKQMRSAKCWPLSSAPKEVREAEGKGYVMYPVSAQPKSKHSIQVTEAAACRRQ